MKKHLGQCIAGIVAIIICSHNAHAAGYTARACGFDMDDDGIIGEQSDCNVCDGVTTDPDGDLDIEDQVYVDCESGVNSANCGTPGSPCRTLHYAMYSTAGSSNTNNRADGTGDGAEDIICVRGTCSPDNQSALNAGSSVAALQVLGAGVKGNGPGGADYRTDAPSGNEFYSFRYPVDPFMIVGWDTDDDGEYPPFDSTQPKPFVIDGCLSPCTSKAAVAEGFDIGDGDNIEIAHFTMRNLNRNGDTAVPRSFSVGFGSLGSTPKENIYVHDIETEQFNWNATVDSNNGSSIRVWSFSAGSTNYPRYVAIENTKTTDWGLWPARGWSGKQNGGAEASAGAYLRFKDNSFVVTRSDFTHTIVPFKLWSVDRIEVIDSVWDYRSTPDLSNSKIPYGIFINKNVSSAYVQGTEFYDVPKPLVFSYKDDDAFGVLKDVYVRRNRVLWSTARGSCATCDRSHVIAITADWTDGYERNAASGTSCTIDSNCSASGGRCDTGIGKCVDPCSRSGPYSNSEHGTGCNCTGAVVPTYVGRFEFTDNFVDFNLNTNIDSVLDYQNGSNCPGSASSYGPLVVAHNTILNWSPSAGHPRNRAFLFGLKRQSGDAYWRDFKYAYGDIYFHNNYIHGAAGMAAIVNNKVGFHGYSPLDGYTSYGKPNDAADGTDDFYASNNIYPSGATFYRGNNSTALSLAQWQAATGQDAGSTTSCVPATQDGLHLTGADTCARDQGTNTYDTAVDIDGQARRVNGTSDIGADEYSAGVPGTIQFSQSSYSGLEGDVSITFTATRTGGSSPGVQATWTTANGTATGATSCDGSSSTDYISGTGTVQWGDGDTAPKTFTVSLCEDPTDEPDESFTVTLSAPTNGATLGSPASATGQIVDNDAVPGSAPIVDTTAGVKTACNTGLGEVLTIPNVTVNAHQDQILLVQVGNYSGGGSTAPWGNLARPEVSVTWNGTPMTLAGNSWGLATFYTDGHEPGTWVANSGIFYLLNPTPGSGSVVIDLNAPDVITNMAASAYSIYQATQSAPSIATWGSPWGGVETPLSTDFSSATGSMLLVDSAVFHDPLGGGNVTPGGGQVERADVSCRYDGYGIQVASSTKDVVAPGVSPMIWSWVGGTGKNRRQAHVIAGFTGVGAPVTTTITTTTSTTTTVTVPNCGNNQVDPPEQCDGPDLNGKKCSNFAPYVHGTLACNGDCTFDTSGCTKNRRGRQSIYKALSWCGAYPSPSCGGTCPLGETCVDTGTVCECQ